MVQGVSFLEVQSFTSGCSRKNAIDLGSVQVVAMLKGFFEILELIIDFLENPIAFITVLALIGLIALIIKFFF